MMDWWALCIFLWVSVWAGTLGYFIGWQRGWTARESLETPKPETPEVK